MLNMVPLHFWPPLHSWNLSPTWATLPTPSTVAQLLSPSGDVCLWPMKRSELSGYWQMHRYYIYSKYFINKLTTPSLYQKSFINNSIVNKIKCMYDSKNKYTDAQLGEGETSPALFWKSKKVSWFWKFNPPLG